MTRRRLYGLYENEYALPHVEGIRFRAVRIASCLRLCDSCLTSNRRCGVGHILLRATLQEGTRIIDTSIPPDMGTLQSVKKEFGSALLHSKHVRTHIPGNKQLKLHELVALTRYHYQKTWVKDWGRDRNGWQRWPAKRARHSAALTFCISLMKQYGFHGYGNPSDDLGIVMFSPERIRFQGIVALLPEQEYRKYQNIAYDDSLDLTLEHLQETYPMSIEELARCLEELDTEPDYQTIHPKDYWNSGIRIIFAPVV